MKLRPTTRTTPSPLEAVDVSVAPPMSVRSLADCTVKVPPTAEVPRDVATELTKVALVNALRVTAPLTALAGLARDMAPWLELAFRPPWARIFPAGAFGLPV